MGVVVGSRGDAAPADFRGNEWSGCEGKGKTHKWHASDSGLASAGRRPAVLAVDPDICQEGRGPPPTTPAQIEAVTLKAEVAVAHHGSDSGSIFCPSTR